MAASLWRCPIPPTLRQHVQAREPYRESSYVEALSGRLSALFLPFLFQYHCYFKRASVQHSVLDGAIQGGVCCIELMGLTPGSRLPHMRLQCRPLPTYHAQQSLACPHTLSMLWMSGVHSPLAKGARRLLYCLLVFQQARLVPHQVLAGRAVCQRHSADFLRNL